LTCIKPFPPGERVYEEKKVNKKTIEDIDVQGKKVFVRVDFNVPLSSKDPKDNITVTDDTRIRASLPTLNYLLDPDPGFPPGTAEDSRR
jgi:hypothetical protein